MKNKVSLWIVIALGVVTLIIGAVGAFTAVENSNLKAEIVELESDLEDADDDYFELLESYELAKDNLSKFQRSGVVTQPSDPVESVPAPEAEIPTVEEMTDLLDAANELSKTTSQFDPQELLDMQAQLKEQLGQ